MIKLLRETYAGGSARMAYRNASKIVSALDEKKQIVVEGKDPRVVTLLGEHGYHLLERYREIDTVNRYFGRADASEKVGG